MKIAAEALAAIAAHARETDPLECCGLLLGTADTITLCARAANQSGQPERRYEIDPQDHFAAIRLARDKGLDVVGAYHSHPRSEPVPSEMDRAEAFEDFVFVIVGRSSGRSCRLGQGYGGREDRPSALSDAPFTIRAWRLSSGNFAELPLVSDA